MSWKSEVEQRKIEAELRRKKQLATVLIIGMVAVGVVIGSWLHYA